MNTINISLDQDEEIRQIPFGELVLAGVPESVRELEARTRRLPTEQVLRELHRRRDVGSALVDALATTFVEHPGVQSLTRRTEVRNYLDLMQAVAGALHKRTIDETIPATMRKEYGPAEFQHRIKQVKGAGERAKEFRKSRKEMEPKYHPLHDHAANQPVDLYFYRNTTPRSTFPLFVVAKRSKLLGSAIDKMARIIAARTDPRNPVIEPHMLDDFSMYDNQGLQVACTSIDEVYRVNAALNASHRLAAAVDIPTHKRFRDYYKDLREQRDYRALHSQMRHGSWLASAFEIPDPLHIQLFTGDSFLLEIYDPLAGHLTHQDRKIDRKETERYEGGQWSEEQGRLVGGSWVRQRNRFLSEPQKELGRRLFEQMLDHYTLVANQQGIPLVHHP